MAKKKIKKKSRKKIKKLKIKKNQIKKEEMPVKKIKVKVIGIGGGAGAIVSDIKSSIKRAKFLVANTDKSSLSKLKRKVNVFQFGQDITGGFGTGMNMETGYVSAEKEIERIKKVLKDADLCILVACLGGGTGSGAVPIFAKTSKKLGNITYGIFTLPFAFEGEKKLEIAKESLRRLRPFVNAIAIIPNERVFKLVDKKVPLKEALSAINKILAFSLEGLIEAIYSPGIINIDFADLKTILGGRGMLSYLNRAEARGEERAKKVLQKILSNPLYPYNISKARKVLFNISGPADLSISEVSEISNGIFNSVKRKSKIVFGVSRESRKEGIDITLLGVGCEMKDFFPKAVKKRTKKPKPKTKEKEIKKEESTPLVDVSKKSNQEKPKLEKKKRKSKKPKVKKKQNSNSTKEKPRKNGLQVQKDVQELEAEIRKKEEVWETPAFLRKK